MQEQQFKAACQSCIDKRIPLSHVNIRMEAGSVYRTLMLSGRETKWRNEVAITNNMVWDKNSWVKL